MDVQVSVQLAHNDQAKETESPLLSLAFEILGFNSHVKSLACSCFCYLMNISELQHMLSSAELEKIIHAFV